MVDSQSCCWTPVHPLHPPCIPPPLPPPPPPQPQSQLTERALELLALPDDGEPKLLLDLGCGSGLSGEALTEKGHIWVVSAGAAARGAWLAAGVALPRGRTCLRRWPRVSDQHLPPVGSNLPVSTILVQGLDISKAMLDVAADREVDGDLLLHDLGHGLPVRPGTVDGVISISAVQWLCNAVRGCAASGCAVASALLAGDCRS